MSELAIRGSTEKSKTEHVRAEMFFSHYRSVESEIKRLFKCIASPVLADRKKGGTGPGVREARTKERRGDGAQLGRARR